jgi:hypothetical protein
MKIGNYAYGNMNSLRSIGIHQPYRGGNAGRRHSIRVYRVRAGAVAFLGKDAELPRVIGAVRIADADRPVVEAHLRQPRSASRLGKPRRPRETGSVKLGVRRGVADPRSRRRVVAVPPAGRDRFTCVRGGPACTSGVGPGRDRATVDDVELLPNCSREAGSRHQLASRFAVAVVAATCGVRWTGRASVLSPLRPVDEWRPASRTLSRSAVTSSQVPLSRVATAV